MEKYKRNGISSSLFIKTAINVLERKVGNGLHIAKSQLNAILYLYFGAQAEPRDLLDIAVKERAIFIKQQDWGGPRIFENVTKDCARKVTIDVKVESNDKKEKNLGKLAREKFQEIFDWSSVSSLWGNGKMTFIQGAKIGEYKFGDPEVYVEEKKENVGIKLVVGFLKEESYYEYFFKSTALVNGNFWHFVKSVEYTIKTLNNPRKGTYFLKEEIIEEAVVSLFLILEKLEVKVEKDDLHFGNVVKNRFLEPPDLSDVKEDIVEEDDPFFIGEKDVYRVINELYKQYGLENPVKKSVFKDVLETTLVFSLGSDVKAFNKALKPFYERNLIIYSIPNEWFKLTPRVEKFLLKHEPVKAVQRPLSFEAKKKKSSNISSGTSIEELVETISHLTARKSEIEEKMISVSVDVETLIKRKKKALEMLSSINGDIKSCDEMLLGFTGELDEVEKRLSLLKEGSHLQKLLELCA